MSSINGTTVPVLTESEWFAVQPVVKGLPFRPLTQDEQNTIGESLIAQQIPKKRVIEVVSYVSGWAVRSFLLFGEVQTDIPAGKVRRRGR